MNKKLKIIVLSSFYFIAIINHWNLCTDDRRSFFVKPYLVGKTTNLSLSIFLQMPDFDQNRNGCIHFVSP